MNIQIAIPKLGFICLIFVVSTGCPSKRTKPLKKHTPLTPSSEDQTKPTSTKVSQEIKDEKRLKGSEKSLDKDPKRNKETNENKKPTQGSEKESKKEDEENKIDKEVKNSVDAIREIYKERECINDKIKNLDDAIQICNDHKMVFRTIGRRHIRIYWYTRLSSYLKKAGLTPIEIAQIQSKEEIEIHLENVKNDLEEVNKALKSKQAYIENLTKKYQNLFN
ncbi:hypothetical protein [Cardinium endosymbiont of Nabis limbatus]|uniref:hypothetical protein n=1 Tax=Cardinium endosymbiont of Nabis limbatus TaxID=3066217 RepID=UPI003AF39E75